MGLCLSGQGLREAEDSLEELAALADTAGAEVVGSLLQRREKPDAALLVGRGKAEELKALREESRADLLIFDRELTPSQQRNLERLCDCRVIDRTALILDIFALHAHTREGKSQVELAQMTYLLTRLTGRGVELSRMGGVAGARGPIGARGPGETKLETDRRRIRKRIEALRRDLAHLEKVRQVKRKRRARQGLFSFSLVGYTNAGKSTMLNRLTRASVPVEDRLFSTLDSTTRRLHLGPGLAAVMTDTVGFIDNLPHQLIEAFKSTLEEVAESSCIVHVIDASAADTERRTASVLDVLAEIGAEGIPRLDLLNKIDRCGTQERRGLERRYPEAVQVSALSGEGLEEARDALASAVLRARPPAGADGSPGGEEGGG